MPSKPTQKAPAKAGPSWQQDGLDSDADDARRRAPLQLGSDDDDDEDEEDITDDEDEVEDEELGFYSTAGEEEEDAEDSEDSVRKALPPRFGLETDDSGSGSEVSFTDSEEEQSEDEETVIRKRIASVPFGTLAKAQRALKCDDAPSSGDEAASDSEADEFQDDRERKRAEVLAQLKAQKEARQAGGGVKGKGKERNRDQGWGGKVAAPREDKHAPMEMTSRKPVSRKRTVIETAATRRRDPRFSSLSASTPNAGIFESSYGFVREQQSDELKELKKTFNALRKQEAHHAGPKARSEQALAIRAERERVEAALRRVEGLENERKRREHETQVMRRHKAEQKQRVEAGGKAFYLKDSAKKALVLQDKFERLSGARAADGTVKEGGAAGGSRQALRKALERRRKKNAQKERRDMPTMGAREAAGKAPIPIPKRKREGAQASAGAAHKRGKRG